MATSDPKYKIKIVRGGIGDPLATIGFQFEAPDSSYSIPSPQVPLGEFSLQISVTRNGPSGNGGGEKGITTSTSLTSAGPYFMTLPFDSAVELTPEDILTVSLQATAAHAQVEFEGGNGSTWSHSLNYLYQIVDMEVSVDYTYFPSPPPANSGSSNSGGDRQISVVKAGINPHYLALVIQFVNTNGTFALPSSENPVENLVLSANLDWTVMDNGHPVNMMANVGNITIDSIATTNTYQLQLPLNSPSGIAEGTEISLSLSAVASNGGIVFYNGAGNSIANGLTPYPGGTSMGVLRLQYEYRN